MLNNSTINIPFTVIKCSCGNELSREFSTIDNFDFFVAKNIRNFGVVCNKCNAFIPITSFLKEEDVIKIMNGFVNTICNL